ncbi:hypothetical protein BLNAU_25189 [Blattamonas nauphoetae]|uniref:Uncharacterized protein n=1 Tax=Blattamonas nauphoetae TaxID=2049346 RepID=A0ABQ9WPA9_9EUKA|nr:hypothetical protein BLNAU_25189 [Blattamonas nauphoetae]
MEEESVALKPSIDACLSVTSELPSTVTPEEEPFLNFDPNAQLSFEDMSRIFNSLVVLVKAGYPLEPEWDEQDLADKLVEELVPSSAGSPSGFVESIATLLSSPHSTVVAAALSFLDKTMSRSSAEIRCRLVDFDLISNILATMQPHTLPISGNEEIITHLIRIFFRSLLLASASSLSDIGITAAVDTFDLRELLFQKVLIPSSRFVTFLISNRYILNRNLFDSFMILLDKFIEISPFHRPTLDFVVASPIAMAITSCLSFVENDNDIWSILIKITLAEGMEG